MWKYLRCGTGSLPASACSTVSRRSAFGRSIAAQRTLRGVRPPPPTRAATASAATALTPGAADLARLAAKYETLATLRRERAAGAPLPGAAHFRALAREFPGALQELDTLPLE